MTELESAKLLKIIYANYPFLELDSLKTRVFFRVLEPFSFEDCSNAAVELLREVGRSYPPTTNEIIGKIKSATKPEVYKSQEEQEDLDLEQRLEIVQSMKEQYPELFTNFKKQEVKNENRE